jgi:hypothetical protein
VIDWSFIRKVEGVRYVGYVPDPKESKSGVTIGCGVDLGMMTDAEFNSLPVALQDVVEPYRHLVGRAAIQKLNASPLSVDTDQVNLLNQIIFNELSSELQKDYDRATGEDGSFAHLTDGEQTCIMSVAFQYGVLAAKCPRFWSDVTTKNWTSAIAELQNFGDAYESRHLQEATLLEGATS